MHDDGARASGPAFAPPPGVLRWARWLRFCLVVSAARDVATWVPGLQLLGLDGTSHLVAMLLSLALVGLWLCWIHATRQHLILLGRPVSFAAPGALWVVMQLVPLVGWLLLARALHGLVAASDPRLLPPVTEEREQDGGFRQNSVVRVEVGSVARPRFLLWMVAAAASTSLPFLAWRSLYGSPLLAIHGALHAVSLLLAVHLVNAVTHNLGELERRVRR